VAESCTGGLIQAYLTEVAGISDVFRGGVVAYHNDVKTGLLDVTSEVVIREGAVCGEVARQMAIGVRQALNSDVSIAITGIAGPAGGSPEKPVGLVWFAYCVYDKVFVEKAVFNGDRAGIRHKAAEMAILKLTRLLKEGTL
jgi:PncC family amidohydrolase